jgi:hypothetical protein
MSRVEDNAEKTSCKLLGAYVLDLLFEPEEESSTFLRNVSKLLPEYTST